MDRDTFISKNIGLVRMVAKRFTKTIESITALCFDDLIGEGTIGLVMAYDRFDPGYGTKFSTYAVPMIEGSIKRFLRDHLDSIKFSRRFKYDFYTISNAKLLNEKPIVISKILDMSIEDVENALGYYKYKYVEQLDRPIYEDEGTPITLGDSVGTEIDFDYNVEIEEFLNKFDDRTKKMMKLRLNDLSQTEIGEVFGVTQVQVSRILKKASKKIQGGIEMGTKVEGTNYELAKKLAKETDLSTSEIMKETGVSYPTAYRYVNDYRTNKAEIQSVKNKVKDKEVPVVSYKLSPEELKKYRLDMPNYNPVDQYTKNKTNNTSIISDINKSIIDKHTKPLTSEVINDWKENKEPIVHAHKAEPTKEIEIEIIKPVKAEEKPAPIINADGYLTLDLKVDTDNVTNQLEEIIKAMKILGFKELNVKIQSQRIA